MNDEQFLTVAEVAVRLRVNPESVRRWLRQGRIRGVMFGGRRTGYRIPKGEVERFIQSGGEPPEAQDTQDEAAA